MRIHTIPRIMVLVPTLCLFGLGACKTTDNQGSGKSLDNMARGLGGPFQQNQCGTGKQANKADLKFIDQLLATPGFLTFSETVASGSRDKLKDDVRTVLKSIPVPLQIGFVGFGGSIVVTDKIESESTCNEPGKRFASVDEDYVDSERTGSMTSCVRKILREGEKPQGNGKIDILMANEEPAVEGAIIYVDAKSDSIHHGLVRAFGYGLVQFMAKWQLDDAKQGLVFADQDQEFKDYKGLLTQSFLKDIATNRAAGKGYDLSLFSKILPAQIIAASDPAKTDSLWQAFRSKDAAVANDFEDYVFAEAFDSFYCSDTTNQVMSRDFAMTTQTFTEAANAIEQLAQNLPVIDKTDDIEGQAANATNNQSLALTASKKETPAKVKGMGLRGFGLLGGMGRAIGGAVRGVGQIGFGVARGAGRVVNGVGQVGVGLVRGTGRVIGGGVRVAGGLVRETGQVVGRVAGGMVRGTVEIARGAGQIAAGTVRGVGQVAAGAARGAGAVAGWVLSTTGQVINGLFGPYLVLRGCQGFTCSNAYSLAGNTNDQDNDTVPDEIDLCSNTPKLPKNATVNKTPDWSGCYPAQKRDRDLANVILKRNYEPNGDYDDDGINNDMDKCSNSPAKKITLHNDVEWNGCAAGQRRDVDVLGQLSRRGL